MQEKYGDINLSNHFLLIHCDMLHTENQDAATYGLLETDADLAIVVGGYNSSNTSHLVELCERKFNILYFFRKEITDKSTINHFRLSS